MMDVGPKRLDVGIIQGIYSSYHVNENMYNMQWNSSKKWYYFFNNCVSVSPSKKALISIYSPFNTAGFNALSFRLRLLKLLISQCFNYCLFQFLLLWLFHSRCVGFTLCNSCKTRRKHVRNMESRRANASAFDFLPELACHISSVLFFVDCMSTGQKLGHGCFKFSPLL